MSTINVEQILAANKSAVAEAQTLAATTLAGFEKLVELNMAAAKAALLEGSADLMAAQAALLQPLAAKSVAYGRSVYAIATETTAALSEAAEVKMAEGQKSVAAAVEQLVKNAPAGSETVVAAFTSAVSAGQNAIDSAKSSAKKAVEMAEKQVTSATDSALNAVKATARKK
jgi:Phasin protein